MVVAGPGTGKTELLSMRTASILQKTDTDPSNILLLTFTESGANAMRERLSAIIGPDAYKVAIHTFHGFGTDIISQYREYFYNGATYKPTDEITTHEIIESIFDTLDYSNPLATKNQGEYVYLQDTVKAISNLKNAGLTSDELLQVLDANDSIYDSVERGLSAIFDAPRINVSMAEQLAPVAQQVAAAPQPALPVGITPIANILALSLAHAIDAAASTSKATPLKDWRDRWMEKNTDGMYVFKDRKRAAKLRAVAYVYFAYLRRMEEEGMFDYDDMVLNVVHAIETRPDLRYGLQEKYQYILVDEFQDTNLAQLRLLFDITAGDQPNVMAVGDDDQAIFSFQGADVNNIHKFREHYKDPAIVVLTDNYRSVPHVLKHSREVITQGGGRLETTIKELNKELSAHNGGDGRVSLHALQDPASERAWVADQIKVVMAAGTPASDIAVIARRHHELVSLVPYLTAQQLSVNYERRDNVLENPAVDTLILIADIVVALHEQRLDDVNALLPELVSQPAFAYDPQAIWQLSLSSYKNHMLWPEAMQTQPVFKPLMDWLLMLSANIHTLPLERMLDIMTGTPDTATEGDFVSPLFSYYFSPAANDSRYITFIEALRTIRGKLREYNPNEQLYLPDFLHYIGLHEQTGTGITSIRKFTDAQTGAVNLLTAHKSKGLEYPYVFILGATDNNWGQKARGKSKLVGYPENLAIAPAGDTYDERLRLFYVAMTRAKQHLTITYSESDSNSKPLMPAAFLSGTSLVAEQPPARSLQRVTSDLLVDWRGAVTAAPTQSMKELLASSLENYMLSVTHLTNFLDVTKGGPQYFLLNNLLHFPSAKNPSAQYGTAIHSTLQRVHNQIKAGIKRPVEDVLNEFGQILEQQHMAPTDHALYLKKGLNSLTKFLEAKYATFTATQKTELGFGGQSVIVGGARLTGSLDLVDLNERSVLVTDYKTGTPARSWKGSGEYEKIKLHKYRQQLMFYELLLRNSRDYAKYGYEGGVLQFVEPDQSGAIHSLEAQFSDDELTEFTELITGVWQHVMALDLPDVADYDPTFKGILAFERDIIDKNI